MSEPARRVVLLGTHGQYNIGDELLLEVFLAQLGTRHRYVVNSYDPAFTGAQLRGRYDIDLVDTRHGRRDLLRHLRRCDRLVFAGGSVVKELYASTGRNRYSTLAMILATVTWAKLVARVPVAMYNVGVGPLATRTGRLLARLVLAQVDELSVRDDRSHRTCLSFGRAAGGLVAGTDAVFSVTPDWLRGGPSRPPAAAQRPRGADGVPRPVRVALNLNYDIENRANWDLFLDRLAGGLAQLHERHPIELHTLPMQEGFKAHDDVEVLDEFIGRVRPIPAHRHTPRTHHDVAAVLERCDLLVSERLHAIIMAAILGVPPLVLAYDVKVRELAAVLGLGEYTIDINRPFKAADLAGRLGALLEERTAVAAAVMARSEQLRARALAGFASARTWVAGSPAAAL